MPDLTSLPPQVAAALAAATDPNAVPPPVTSTGPTDAVPVGQEPGFEEADVSDADAESALADPDVNADTSEG